MLTIAQFDDIVRCGERVMSDGIFLPSSDQLQQQTGNQFASPHNCKISEFLL